MPPPPFRLRTALAAGAASLAACALVAWLGLRATGGTPVPVTLYVADRQGMFLVPTPATLVMKTSPERAGAQLFEALRQAPGDGGVSAVPDDARWVDGTYAAGRWRLTVSLSQVPGSTGERLLVGALVRTFLGAVPGAREVRLTLTDREGHPLPSQHLDLGTPLTLSDVGNQLPSGAGGPVKTTLWWAARDSGALVPVQVSLGGDAGLPPQDALERLTAGPGAEASAFLAPIVPGGLQPRWVTLAGGIAHVELGGPLPAGAAARRLVAAIVMSLTEFPEVRAVQLLMGGKPVAARLDALNLAAPVARRDVMQEGR
ncbi:MAG: GerMN domain-containing protein [Candidatus Sericytochromatia bacterium]|nr:GerMN domain-containing protein [Candidatus Sericytochromatia bacterium]